MSSSDFLIDAATRHSVFLQRHAGQVSLNAQDVLARMQAEILRQISEEPPEFQRIRLKRLMETVTRAINSHMTELNDEIVQAVFELAKSEAQFSVNMFNQVSTVPLLSPTEDVLRSAIFRHGMDVETKAGVLTIKEAINLFAKGKAREIISTINDAVTNGVPTSEAAKQIAELIGTRHTRQVNTLARTITNFTSIQARQMVLADNSAIVDRYEWVSVLDHRTTLLCAGRDGKIYKEGKGPLPPAHWGCRSTIIPVVKPEFEIKGLKGKRPSEDGKISPDVTYGDWLSRQSEEFQVEVLGPSRAALFRSGALEIERFRDETGIVYSLERLEQLEPMAFQRAGVRVDGQRLVNRE